MRAQGFTLLEMLLALALGALLMGTITTSVTPLLKEANVQTTESHVTNSQAQALMEMLERNASRGFLVFPTVLDNANNRTSLAIQLTGTGLDLDADANADGVAGIARMDTTADRGTVTSIEDDDRDGTANEDPINGVDDDFDGLVDEDPGHDQEDNGVSGVEFYDDNDDGLIDNIWSKSESKELHFWTPFIPNSLVSDHQISAGTVGNLNSTARKEAKDDNEDGMINNAPAITWSVSLDNSQLICTTPLVSHQPHLSYSRFTYFDYVCLDDVKTFSVLREYNANGQIQTKIELVYLSAEQLITINKTLMLR